MLDTKLKNRHKLAVFLIILIILIPAMTVLEKYGEFFYEVERQEEESMREAQVSDDFIGKFAEVCYILYNRELTGKTVSGTETPEEEKDDFRTLAEENDLPLDENDFFETYLDYRVVDEKNSVVAKTVAASSSNYPADGNLTSYAIGMRISFDGGGVPSAVISQGEYKDEQSRILTRELGNFFEETQFGRDVRNTGLDEFLKVPENRTFFLAMSKESMTEYLNNTFAGYGIHSPSWFVSMILFLMAAVAGAALLLPRFRTFQTGDEKIFRVPFELPAAALLIAVMSAGEIAENRIRVSSDYNFFDFLMWIAIFAAIYWGAACLRHIFSMGPKRYFKECTLAVPAFRYAKKAWGRVVSGCRRWFDRLYRSFDDLDFSGRSNKAILKLVLVNFAILAVISCFWFAGIAALVIYSVILYLILQKYFNDLKGKYACLLKATNQMAQGNLDVEITEDLGVFNPFKAEIAKIQDGYQKAVEKEVKSQRMKTELITNVSHDLKTPLTAIITYVNLLKEEKDEEKRKDYIDVLERKSLRLKALIEDLFEISKASSKNITLNFVDVDVVNLFKQVRLEHAEKFEEAGLSFRCTYPEEKAVARLDSQKTYRIIENLLVNVAKYALPNTRVYVKIEKTEGEVILRMMNISAAELNFNADEITERFVRGDASRNTEGSGLGLAIAKSFTELQKGRFMIETEGDLFKAEAAFPCA